MNIHFERGVISKNLKVLDAVIRTFEDLDDYGDFPIEKMKLQARLKNITSCPVENVKCDVSYYAKGGHFLGLDLTDSLELDEIDPSEVIPVSLHLQMPEDTDKCVLNIHSRKMSHPGSLSNVREKNKNSSEDIL